MQKLIFFKFLILSLSLAVIAKASDFKPLTEEDKFSIELGIPMVKTVEKKAIAIHSDGHQKEVTVTTVTTDSHTVLLQFNPSRLSPVIIKSEFFPEDADALLRSFCDQVPYKQKHASVFGYQFVSKEQSTDGQEYITTMIGSPETFLHGLHYGFYHYYQLRLHTIYNKNRSLMTKVKKFLIDSPAYNKFRTARTLQNIAALLCYSFGGAITLNPEEGISFRINIPPQAKLPSGKYINIVAQKNKKNNPYREYLKKCLQEYLKDIHVSFDFKQRVFFRY